MRQNVNVMTGVPDEYLEAELLLKRVKNKVNRIGMNFPDVTSFDFDLEKYSFRELPESIARGVRTMGIHLEEDYRSLIVTFDSDSFLSPHFHSEEIEAIQVLDGEILDKVTCTIYERGDAFIIPKGQLHEIVTLQNSSIMFIVFSRDEKVIEEMFKDV